MSAIEKDNAGAQAADVSHEEIAKPNYGQGGGDEALKALDGDDEVYSEEEYAAVRRKIDWRITPVLFLINMIQLVDKNTLGSAATYGLIQQANLQGTDYSMLITLFYLGYLVAEYPSTWLMQKCPTGKYLMANFIIWGAVLAATSAATNFTGLAIGRFLLGVFEAPLNPGLVIVTSSWWRTEEQARRIGVWYSMMGFATIPITMVFYGTAHIETAKLYPYQWMFLIFGALTCLIGISLWWTLPDSPMNARFLNARERKIAIKRIQNNQTGLKNREHKRYQVWEALKDPKVWMLAGGVFFQNMTNTLQNSFNGLIIKGLGFNTYQAVLLTLPVGFIFGSSCLAVTWFLGSKHGQGKRCFAIMICYLPGLVSTVILYKVRVSDSTVGVLLFALFFLNVISTCASVMYSLLASNIAGYTKKSVVNSIFFISYSLGNIVSPQAFLQREAPVYQTGIAVTLASFCVNIVLFGSLYCIYTWENKKRDKLAEGQPPMTEEAKTLLAFSDLTDNENKTMRYAT